MCLWPIELNGKKKEKTFCLIILEGLSQDDRYRYITMCDIRKHSYTPIHLESLPILEDNFMVLNFPKIVVLCRLGHKSLGGELGDFWKQ